jgi:hypothetical protein
MPAESIVRAEYEQHSHGPEERKYHSHPLNNPIFNPPHLRVFKIHGFANPFIVIQLHLKY